MKKFQTTILFTAAFLAFAGFSVSAHNKAPAKSSVAKKIIKHVAHHHKDNKDSHKENHKEDNDKNHGHYKPNPTPTPTVTPKPDKVPTVSNVSVKPCTSSSCASTTTVQVQGAGFTANTRAKLVKGSVEFSITNAKAQYVGGNGSTQIIMDFYGAPVGVYDLVIYSTTNEFSPITKSSAVSL